MIPEKKDLKNPIAQKLSKIYPFKLFIIDTNRPPKGLTKITSSINKSGLSQKITINDVLIFQTLVIILSILISVALYIFKISNVINLTAEKIIYIFVAIISLSLVIKEYIKHLIKTENRKKISSIPMINNYLITMLKGDKIISEILYSLTIIETPYKAVFTKGYIMYGRDNESGFDYLIDVFKDTYFKETLKVLRDFNKYNKETSLKYLSRLNILIKRQIKQIKKKKFDIDFIYSQLSVVFPLILLGLLIIIPIVSVAFKMMRTSVIIS